MTTSTPRAPQTGAPQPVAADPAILHRNLAAIARRDPALAAAIGSSAPSADAVFTTAPDGAVTGTLCGRAMASQRGPLDEARRLADTISLETTGGIVVLGFGMGHHCAELARRGRNTLALVIYEPDVPLLRAVLERIDHSAWLAETGWAIATSPDDGVALHHALRGFEAPLAIGTAILEHPPSRARLAESGARFGALFARTFAAMRTHIITTMMQTDVTVRNELMNAADYVRRPGIDALAGLCAGRPAIVVSAGPSLRRNVELLRTPGLRDRCVIIAVQTVLKQLLAMGIRPHFVTAIDYHEISRRFYEGLTPEMVEGVTLVVEPRANGAILDAFPGSMRVPGDDLLDTVLGRPFDDRARLTPAATVAHQAYYLARFMGADPVVLIGQDLAFTDGQYYAPGAAIHETWAPELNPFTSLERLEWERIARARGTLLAATDHLGRRVYTDEQMSTYLAQFERDFAADADRGLVTIDATEGGVRKEHCAAMPLREALDRFAHAHVAPIPPIDPAPPGADARMDAEARGRIRSLARDVRRIARDSNRTIELLRKLPDLAADRDRTNRIIAQIDAIRDEVQGLDPAFGVVMRLNQTGAFKRFKADRLIRLAQNLAPEEVHRRRIDRDITNVEWIRDMAEVLGDLLDESERVFEGGSKRTHDAAPRALDAECGPDTRTIAAGALVFAPNGSRAAASFLGEPMIARTLERLAGCRRISAAIVVTDNPDAISRAIEHLRVPFPVRVERVPEIDSRRMRSIGAARGWSGTCWRGGVASMTIFDEVLDPGVLGPIVDRERWDGALVVGAEWCLIDPAICDRLIDRHAESPEGNPFTFSQAPPGLAACFVSRAFLADLCAGAPQSALHATPAAALGYVPLRPRSDPIAKPSCIQIDAQARSTVARFLPDTSESRDRLERVLRPHAPSIGTMRCDEITRIVRDDLSTHPSGAPATIAIELTGVRPWRTFPGVGSGGARVRGHMPTDQALALVRSLGCAYPCTPVAFTGGPVCGDPMMHPDWLRIVAEARACGLGPIHVRTSMAGEIQHESEVLRAGIDVLSIDLLAHQAHTYAALTGIDAYAQVVARIDAMLAARAPGFPLPWIVPRITRCDAVYEELEVFFDKWTIVTGAAVIDALVAPITGDSIEPLPVPHVARAAAARANFFIRSDLTVAADALDPASDAFTRVDPDDTARAWRALSEARHQAIAARDWSNPILNTHT